MRILIDLVRRITFVALAAVPLAAAAQTSNNPPVFTPVAAQQVDPENVLRFGVSATDPDGDALSISMANPPSGARFLDFGDGTGAFAWMPALGQEGVYNVTFQAVDAGSPMASAQMDVRITVGTVTNTFPVLDPVGDQLVYPGTTLTLSLSASDADGDALAFDAQPLPAGATLTGNVLEWAPNAGDVGSYPVTITVSDSFVPPGSDSESIVITVGAVNTPPVLTPIGDRSAQVGDSVRIAVISSDADGDAVSLACSGLPADASFTDLMDRTGEIVWMPSAAGQWSVTCQATDSGTPTGVAEETFSLTATAPPPPPTDPTGPVVTEADWSDAEGFLHVRGHLTDGVRARRVGVYAVLADGTPVLLGNAIPRRSGTFEAVLAPFVAPCRVAVAAHEQLGAAVAVANAPARCDEQLLLSVRSARLTCSGHGLQVLGRRAPPAARVLGSDDASGAPLFGVATRRGGSFAAKARVAQTPSALDVSVETAGHRWTLDEPVTLERGRCSAKGDH